MRDRFPLVVIGALVLLAISGSFLLKGAARGGFAEPLSTWRSQPDGARGIYLLGFESGIAVGRHQSDLELLDAGASQVLLGIPPDALTDDEVDKLLAHVAAGHDLIYALEGAGQDALLEKLGVKLAATEGRAGVRSFVPAAPTRWTLGVGEARAEAQTHLELPDSALPLLVDRELGFAVAGLVNWHKGHVVVLSAPELAMNKRLAEADNAQLWLSLLRTASRSGRVLFDEFHHGFSDDRSIATFAARYGLHFAIAQLLFGTALWALAMRRFGRPLVPKEEERIGSHDALFASSRIYREGRHYQWSASLIARGLAQDLAEHVGLPASAQLPEVAQALRARNEDAIATSLEEVDASAQRASTETDVLACATRAAQARTTLHERHRSAA